MTTTRQFGGRFALLGLLGLIILGGPMSPNVRTPAQPDLASAPPSSAVGHGRLELRRDHVDPRADGAIDTFEDDDSGQGEADSSYLEGTDSFAAGSSPVARLTSDVVARSRLARAPPSA